MSASAAPNPEIKISVPVGGEQFEEQAAIFVCGKIITRPCSPVVGIDIVNSETGLLRVPFFYVGFSGLLKPVFRKAVALDQECGQRLLLLSVLSCI